MAAVGALGATKAVLAEQQVEAALVGPPQG
jgi:hypothetical protein